MDANVMAAYFLAYTGMGGCNGIPSSYKIKTILTSAGIDIEDERLHLFMSRAHREVGNVANIMAMLKELMINRPSEAPENKAFPASSSPSTNDRLGTIPIYFDLHEDVPNISDKFPKNFRLADAPKFKGTECPHHYIRFFESHMILMGVKEEVFPLVFRLVLEDIHQRWFYSLDRKKIRTWKDVVQAFVAQYADNVYIEQINQRTLELLYQDEDEGFTDFLTRWRSKCMQIANRPDESTLVKIFINNLRQPYARHLRYKVIDTFKSLAAIGYRIEDDLNNHTYNENCF